MSGGKLTVKQVLGLNSKVKNCMTFLQEHHLAYVCGHQIVVINTETREQSFIPGTFTYQHQSLGFSSMASCPGKKILAVAEKVDPIAIVTIYDTVTLRKKKTISSPEFGSSEIRCMAFSDDGRYLLTQGAGPEWNLTLWHVEKAAKAICSTKISLSDDNPVHEVAFCPWDPNVILVIGKSILRFFRFVEGQLRPISITVRREANFISHCFLPDEYIIIGTENGELLLIENFEVRGHINTNKFDQTDGNCPANCLSRTSRGFIMGSTQGEIKLFEKHDDIKEKYALEDTYYIPGDNGNILEFALDVDELLVCGTDRHQLMSCTMSSLYNVKEGSNIFDHVFTSFHMPNIKGECEITGIDIALWKQIVVTCGKDRTVRVWNPVDKKIELFREFDEEPSSLSVHPNGIYVVVAFSEKISILSLLLEEIYTAREITARQCSYVKFSQGGEYFAAAIGTTLNIYQTFTGSLIATLRGHNNKIKSVMWMNFDSRLYTVGVDGTVNSWDLFPAAKRPEHYPGNVPIFHGIGPQDGSVVYIATHDRLVKELCFNKSADGVPGSAVAKPATNNANPGATTNNALVPPGSAGGPSHGGSILDSVVKVSRSIELPNYVNCMAFDETRRYLAMGTTAANEDSPCSVTVTLSSPYLGGGGANPILDANLIHIGTVTALCISSDGTTVYSADSSGNLIISEFENAAFASSKTPIKQREGLVSFEFIEEIVIHKADLSNRKNLIQSLTNNVDEINRNNEYQMRLKEIEYTEKLKEITNKFSEQLSIEKIKYNELESEKNAIEKEFHKKLKLLEDKHVEELKNIELKYKTKYNAEETRHKLLIEETEEAHRLWNEENAMLIRSHQKYLEELAHDYEFKLSSEQKLQRELQLEKDRLQVVHDSSIGNVEGEGDREVAEMKIKYDAKLRMEEDMAQGLITQHTTMSKAYEALVRESAQQKVEIKRLKDKEGRLYETIHTLEKDIQSHKKEIREREETITDKEKRIFDLKKKNQELEKFRFVLDYKIKELKLQITPRENEINTMRKQLEEMNIELEQYHKSNLSLNLMINELKLKVHGINHELEIQQERFVLNETFYNKFKQDLHDLYTYYLHNKQNMNMIKNNVIKFYRLYLQEIVDVNVETQVRNKQAMTNSGQTSNKPTKVTGLDDPQEIYNRDREQMERNLHSLRRAMKMSALTNQRDANKMVRESIVLIKELNNLRKNTRSLQLQKKAIESAGDLNNPTNLFNLMELLGLQLKKTSKSNTKSKNPANPGDHLLPTAPPNITKPTPPSRTTALRASIMDPNTAINTNNNSLGLTSANNSPRPPMTSPSKRASITRQDQWEAWREIQIQYDTMRDLEDKIVSLCQSIDIDPVQLIVAIDAKLDEQSYQQQLQYI